MWKLRKKQISLFCQIRSSTGRLQVSDLVLENESSTPFTVLSHGLSLPLVLNYYNVCPFISWHDQDICIYLPSAIMIWREVLFIPRWKKMSLSLSCIYYQVGSISATVPPWWLGTSCNSLLRYKMRCRLQTGYMKPEGHDSTAELRQGSVSQAHCGYSKQLKTAVILWIASGWRQPTPISPEFAWINF
jgi:hypothetical protein